MSEAYEINLVLLRAIGFYPPKSNFNVILHTVIPCIIYVLLYIIPASYGIYQLFLDEDFSIMDYDAVYTVAWILYTIKYSPFIWNNKNIEHCIKCVDSHIFNWLTNRHEREEMINLCRKITQLYIFTLSVSILGMVVKGLILKESLYLSYWSRLFSTAYGGISCGGVDPLIWCLAYFAKTQVRILKQNLRNLWESSDGNLEILTRKLKLCVLHHQAIIKFVAETENSISFSIFTQIAGSAVIIALCCLQNIKADFLSLNFILSGVYLVALVAQIFFFCYFGTLLEEESSLLSTAGYMGDWYKFDYKTQKILILLMGRSIKPLQITAMNLFPMNLDTFTTVLILKRAYSLVAVLRSLEE